MDWKFKRLILELAEQGDEKPERRPELGEGAGRGESGLVQELVAGKGREGVLLR